MFLLGFTIFVVIDFTSYIFLAPFYIQSKIYNSIIHRSLFFYIKHIILRIFVPYIIKCYTYNKIEIKIPFIKSIIYGRTETITSKIIQTITKHRN